MRARARENKNEREGEDEIVQEAVKVEGENKDLGDQNRKEGEDEDEEGNTENERASKGGRRCEVAWSDAVGSEQVRMLVL